MTRLHTIRDAALSQFAEHGYEGTSLSGIAGAVGIKTPSLYAHYASKDDLFLQVVQHAFRLEERRIVSYFSSHAHKTLEEVLYGFFAWIEGEYHNCSTAKFVLRMSFFPPVNLTQQVMAVVIPFYAKMERLLQSYMLQADASQKLLRTSPAQAALAFTTIVDGTIVDLLYDEGRAYRRRVEAVWPIMWHGMSIGEE